jgi:hypothetical protein
MQRTVRTKTGLREDHYGILIGSEESGQTFGIVFES